MFHTVRNKFDGAKEDETGETNAERADSALAIVKSMVGSDPNDLEASIKDLITDLLHLAHRSGYDVEALLRSAEMHWSDES